MSSSVRLGRTNVEVSTVGLGTWAFGGPRIVNGRSVGWFGTEDCEARRALLRAHALGIRHWDTADVYGGGHAERLIGSVWGEVPRAEVFLATKVGWEPGSYGHPYHPEQIRHQLETSLRNLETEQIDLYYLHRCDFGPDEEYLDDALDELERFREEGKIRFLGLSDWKNELLMRFVHRVGPDVVQCYRNVVDDTYEESGLRQWVDENDAGVVFFSPLKHSLLLGQFEGPVTFGKGDYRSTLFDFRDYGLLARLRACRRELEKHFAGHPEPVLHALVGALLADAPTGSVLVGLRKPEYVEAAAQAGERLSAEDRQWVRRLYRENGKPTRASWRNFQPSF